MAAPDCQIKPPPVCSGAGPVASEKALTSEAAASCSSGSAGSGEAAVLSAAAKTLATSAGASGDGATLIQPSSDAGGEAFEPLSARMCLAAANISLVKMLRDYAIMRATRLDQFTVFQMLHVTSE